MRRETIGVRPDLAGSGQEQQETSYEARVAYYTEKIKSNFNWKMASIFADDGKSATSTVKRSDFQAMAKSIWSSPNPSVGLQKIRWTP